MVGSAARRARRTPARRRYRRSARETRRSQRAACDHPSHPRLCRMATESSSWLKETIAHGARELVDFARSQGYRLDELVEIIEDVG